MLEVPSLENKQKKTILVYDLVLSLLFQLRKTVQSMRIILDAVLVKEVIVSKPPTIHATVIFF